MRQRAEAEAEVEAAQAAAGEARAATAAAQAAAQEADRKRRQAESKLVRMALLHLRGCVGGVRVVVWIDRAGREGLALVGAGQ